MGRLDWPRALAVRNLGRPSLQNRWETLLCTCLKREQWGLLDFVESKDIPDKHSVPRSAAVVP
eukprot:970316-Amphidinium_carterae.3